MFDFKVKYSESGNTVAHLKTDSGVEYFARFICGKYRCWSVDRPREFNSTTLNELTRQVCL